MDLKFRIGCFRRLSLTTRLIIIGFHTFTLLTLVAILATTVHSRVLQRNLRAELRTGIGETANKIEHVIYGGVCFRFLAILVGFYSVKTRHSPGTVILFTAMVTACSTILIASGISICIKCDSVEWVREFMELEMDEDEDTYHHRHRHVLQASTPFIEIYHREVFEMSTPDIKRLQAEKKCCGIDSYRDWQDFPFGITSLRVPPSCCRPPRWGKNFTLQYCGQNLLPEHPQASKLIYTRGCFKVLTARIVNFLLASAILCIIIGVFDAVLATFGMVLVLKEYV